MESIILARFLGIFFLIWGLAALVNHERWHGAIDELVKSKMMQLIAALIPLILGSFFVAVHNVWVKNWTVSITIMGWLFLLGGIFRALMTVKWIECVTKMKNKVNFGIAGVIIAGIGVFFLYFGYCSAT